MNSLISSSELTKSLEEVIPNCENLNLISAFVTKPAINWLQNLVDNSSVCLVGRFSPKDFIDGASSIDALRDCIYNRYKVKALSNLHAKIYQIDCDLIYTGSANLTGKGLALVDSGNLEACAKVSATDETRKFINLILNASIEINLETLDKMQMFIDNITAKNDELIPTQWPENILPTIENIFVSDLPLGSPGESVDIYSINPSLEFSCIESHNSDFNTAQSCFKNSKVYTWLKSIVVENEAGRDLGFGQVSSLLHDVLSDDPSPYRREIKALQANLYEYIKIYASDEIEIYVPGRRSQVLRLLN